MRDSAQESLNDF